MGMMLQGGLARSASVGRQAVERLRDVVRAGTWPQLLGIDRQTGEVLSPEARALFASLPTLTPASAPEELLEHGLLTALPKHWSAAYQTPRYSDGAPVFVQTTVSHKPATGALSVGRFDAQGPVAFTHQGTLRARRGDVFLVDVAGAPTRLPFASTDIFAWNQPCGVPSSGGTLSGINLDYTDPLWKAHICVAYLQLADAMLDLDFKAAADELHTKQAQIVRRLAERVRMHYAGRGEGYAGTRAGALLSNGQGVCFVQRAVAVAFLQVFARVLAFDVQAAVGRTLSLDVAHGFAVIVLRPSLRRYVCDPAWSEPLTDLRVAFHSQAWGQDRRLMAFEGQQEQMVPPSDISLAEEES